MITTYRIIDTNKNKNKVPNEDIKSANAINKFCKNLIFGLHAKLILMSCK